MQPTDKQQHTNPLRTTVGHTSGHPFIVYLELKKKGLLEHFANNVNIISESKASYTLELMPHDELVEFIPEIMSFSMKKFGAYPQLTVGRDEQNSRKLLTKFSEEEYIRIWKVFQSEMFDLKMKFYMMHGTNCNAGKELFICCSCPARAWNRLVRIFENGNFE